MAYPIPGYLEHPADLAGNMLSGFQAGASVARAQAELQQQAQQAGIQIAERQSQMQLEHARQQQQMEMTRQLHQAQLGLKQTQLAQAQQKINLATQAAAQKFTAHQQVQQRISELTGGGMEIGQATRQAFLENASNLGLSGQGVAGLTRPADKHATWIPADPATGAPGHFESAGGGVTIPARLKEQGQLTPHDILNSLRQDEKELAADPMVKLPIPKNASPEMRAQAQQKKDEYKQVRQRIEDLRSGRETTMPVPKRLMEQAPGMPQAAPTAPPAPSENVRRVVSIQRASPEAAQGYAATAMPHTEAQDETPKKDVPPVSFDKFLNALKTEKVKLPEIAVAKLGDELAKRLGPAPTHPMLAIGSSSISHRPGLIYEQALLHGRSKLMPGLTGQQVEQYIKTLPPEEQSQILFEALDAAGFDTGSLYPVKPKPAAEPEKPKESKGFE